VLVAGGVRVEGFRAVDDDVFELCVQLFEDRFRETGANVADCFVGVGSGVVASKEESTIDRSALSFAVVGSQNYEIEGVANAREVIFLDLNDVSRG